MTIVRHVVMVFGVLYAVWGLITADYGRTAFGLCLIIMADERKGER